MRKGGTMFKVTFIKNPLTGTTVINGQEDRYEKEKSLFPGYMSNSFTVLL